MRPLFLGCTSASNGLEAYFSICDYMYNMILYIVSFTAAVAARLNMALKYE